MFKSVCCICLLSIGVLLQAKHIDKSKCKENPLNRNTFTYILTNVLQEPYFNYTAILVVERDAPFIYYMGKAMDICRDFTKMSARYYKDVGWFITSLNNVTADYTNDQTFWTIINTYGKTSQLGASNFIPQHNSVYTMNFTMSATHP